jgi:hypothetical protein
VGQSGIAGLGLGPAPRFGVCVGQQQLRRLIVRLGFREPESGGTAGEQAGQECLLLQLGIAGFTRQGGGKLMSGVGQIVLRRGEPAHQVVSGIAGRGIGHGPPCGGHAGGPVRCR